MITREDCIQVGEITKTHNLQGAVIVSSDSDLLERYADEPVFLLLEGAPVPFFIAEDGLTVRNHSSYIVKFDYVDSLSKAERLVGCEVLLERELLEEDVDEDLDYDYDVFDLVDCEVEDEVSGAAGKILDVADYSGNDILTVSIFDKEVLLPLSDTYVLDVDFEQNRVLVHIPEELAELN